MFHSARNATSESTPRCPASGAVAREKGSAEEKRGYAKEGRRVQRTDTEQDALEHPGHGKTDDETDARGDHDGRFVSAAMCRMTPPEEAPNAIGMP